MPETRCCFTVSEGLPAGWASAIDPRYGMPYYFNAGTGQRQWQKPGAELPPGWQEARDPRSGLPYFFNLATGQRVWEHPGRSTAGAHLCSVLVYLPFRGTQLCEAASPCHIP